MRAIPRPTEGEYAPYTIAYIAQVPDDEMVLQHLEDNMQRIIDHLNALTVPLDVPHAPGEWTVKQILAHHIELERVFTYRALRFARGDKTPLPGYDQDDYADSFNANEIPLEDLYEEYRAVRKSTLTFFHNLPDEVYTRSGPASSHETVSVRACLYIICGHELYHLESIKENYG